MAVLEVPPFIPECPLEGYRIECGGGWDVGHIIARGKANGNDRVKSELDRVENLMWMCHWHNIQRWADTPEAVAWLFHLQAQRPEMGVERIRAYLNGLPWKVTKEYRYNRVMSALDPVGMFGEEFG